MLPCWVSFFYNSRHLCSQSQKSRPYVKSRYLVVQLLILFPNQIIGGYVFDSFLSTWTLVIKALGLALSVSSGLSLGKEVNLLCLILFPRLIILGAIGTHIMLHVVPFHEAFL